MKLYREQILIETLLKFRLKRYSFSQIKVECYNRFEGDTTKCRLEVFKGGKGIKYRIMEHEAELTDSFVLNVEERLEGVLKDPLTPIKISVSVNFLKMVQF